MRESTTAGIFSLETNLTPEIKKDFRFFLVLKEILFQTSRKGVCVFLFLLFCLTVVEVVINTNCSKSILVFF